MRIYAVFLDPSYFFLFSPPFPFLRLLRSFSPAVALVFFFNFIFYCIAPERRLFTARIHFLISSPPSFFFFSLKQLNSPI